MDAIREVLAEYQDYLMSLDNVIGVGIGYKTLKGEKTNELAIIIFVNKKLPQAHLWEDQVVPRKLDKVSTDVVEAGEVNAFERTTNVRPAYPGVSIGHFQVGAGTFGAVVRDKKTDESLILSNNHILADATNGTDGRALIGDPIYQPGLYDGGVGEDALGYLERFIPIIKTYEEADYSMAVAALNAGNRVVKMIRPNYRLRLEINHGITNKVDAAVARPIKKDLISPEIFGLGRVKGVGRAKLGLNIRKSGRTSGVTSGIVTATDVTINVQYGKNETALFSDQVMADIKSRPGDSGSLIVDDELNAVGLLFAGSDNITVFNNIANVTAALDVKF